MHEYLLHYIMFMEYLIIYQSGTLKNFCRKNRQTIRPIHILYVARTLYVQV